MNNSLTDWFFIKTGVCQGCILSPLLFGITIDWVMKRSMENKTTGIKWLNNTTVEDLGFADVITLLSHSYNDQQIKTASPSEHQQEFKIKNLQFKCHHLPYLRK